MVSLSLLTLLLSAYKSGIGINFDSIMFISCAQNLASGKGLHMYNGAPLLYWPPLYPIMLSVLLITGLHYPEATFLLNLFFFSALTLIFTLYLRKILGKNPLFYPLSLLIFSLPILKIYTRALSEAPFVLFVFLFLVLAERYKLQPRGGSLRLLSAVSVLSSLSRYIGAFTFPIVSALIWMKEGKKTKAFFWGLLSTLPLALWFLRNYLISHTLAGRREVVSKPLWDKLYKIFHLLLYRWFSPVEPLAPLFFLLWILILGAAIYRAFSSRAVKEKLIVPILLLSSYFFFLLLSFLYSEFPQKAFPRFLAPLFPVFLILLALSLREISTTQGLKRAVLIFVLLFTLSHLYVSTKEVLKYFQSGITPASNLKNSALITYIKRHSLPGPIFCNSPPVLYLYTGRSSLFIPRRGRSLSPLKKRGRTLIWFKNLGERKRYSLREIRWRVKLLKVFSCRKGKIFLIEN